MAVVGRLLLIFCLISSVYGLGASVYGARGGGREWVDSGRRTMYVIAAMAAIAFVILDVAFITSNFSYKSSRAARARRRRPSIAPRRSGPHSRVLAAAVGAAALLVVEPGAAADAPQGASTNYPLYGAQSVLFNVQPGFFFVRAQRAVRRQPLRDHERRLPSEGAGLDLLLRHTTMMIHPPMLYSGYTLLTVPFAFAVGALITRQARAPSGSQVTRRFALGRVAVPRHRDSARRALVLHRAGLGRLLGLGPGRERGADAVAVLRRPSSTRS